MNKPRIALILIVLLILILSVAQTVVSNSLSTSGILMSKLDQEIKKYKTENLELSEKLFMASALNTISTKAEELGFVEGKSHYVITSSLPLAIRQ